MALNADESELLVQCGWVASETDDGPEFSRSFEDRTVVIAPVLMRKLKPMTFRPQGRYYAKDYSRISIELGWGGRLGKQIGQLPASAGLDTFKTAAFDLEFARALSEKIAGWVKTVDPIANLEAKWSRRTRSFFDKGDLIDLVFLGRKQDLEDLLSLAKSDESVEFRMIEEPLVFLETCIDLVSR